MNSDFLYKGFWWSPEHPKNKLPGELKFDKSGSLLLTLLSDQNYIDFLLKRDDYESRIPIINGHARNTETNQDLAFTLFDNYIVSHHISSLTEFKIQSKFASTLKYFTSERSIKISSAFFKLNLLHEWINVSGLKNVKYGNRKFKITVGYEQPKPITLFKNKFFVLYLFIRVKAGGKRNDYRITEQAYLNLEFKKQIDVEEFNKHLELVKNFFSFCISLPVSCQHIEFQEHSTKALKKLGVDHQHTYELLLSDTRVYTKRESLQNDVMLISYERIKGNEIRYFETWLELNKKIEPVLKLYFDTLYNPDLYKENVFLNYVAALEIYHRICFPEFDGKDEAYMEKLDKILESIPKANDKNWIASRLKKRKEVSLFNRLLHITNRTPQISERLADDPVKFCKLAANTRNYYTHFDQNNKKNGVAEGKQLIGLMHKMRIYLQIQILLDLGFEEKEIDLLIKKAISNWYTWNSD